MRAPTGTMISKRFLTIDDTWMGRRHTTIAVQTGDLQDVGSTALSLAVEGRAAGLVLAAVSRAGDGEGGEEDGGDGRELHVRGGV